MKVSVIIPVYNAEAYIEHCLASVIEQTFKDWECIVIDDGSTDGSWALVQKMAANDSRFILLRQESNRGVSAARNAGLKVASGDAVCFVDADDWCDVRMLEYLVSRAEAFPSVGRVITPAIVHREATGVRYIWYISPFGLLPPDSAFPFADSRCDIGHVTGCLYIKRNIPFEMTFPRVRIFEDMIFNMGLIFSGVSSLVADVSVYHYTRRDGSLVSGTTLTKADAVQARAALDYLASVWMPSDEIYERFLQFLQNALNGKMKRE